MSIYIYQQPDWPRFRFRREDLIEQLTDVSLKRGQLLGRLDGLGLAELQEAKVSALSSEVVNTSEIEGEHLDMEQVRSSIASQLGLDAGGVPVTDRRIDGVVEMAVDAAENWQAKLTEERLFRWHRGLFPTGRGSYGPIRTAAWRDDALGPMQVVSGSAGRERVHFQAPPAAAIPAEMRAFLNWFESESDENGLIFSGLAHLWFITIHPFDDGNGRIGRAILDLALARLDRAPYRCYSVSAQICQERRDYYNALERAQKGTLDVTGWLGWYLGCLGRAVDEAGAAIADALERARFWSRHADKTLNYRQRKMLARMLMGWRGKMTIQKWSRAQGVSDKTAQRDIHELVRMGILERDAAGGRSTGYHLLPPRDA